MLCVCARVCIRIHKYTYTHPVISVWLCILLLQTRISRLYTKYLVIRGKYTECMLILYVSESMLSPINFMKTKNNINECVFPHLHNILKFTSGLRCFVYCCIQI